MNRLSCFFLIVLFSCTDQFSVPNHVPGVVKIFNDQIFVAYGEGGLMITDGTTEEVLAHITPPRTMNSIDDLDVDGNLLFVLDARNKNYLAVYSIEDINDPILVDGPQLVNGGPFNGVSASAGNLVVSGGTLMLEYFQYSASGGLNGSSTFGRDRGHPDVLLSANGQVAFVSTDFQIVPDQPRFGVISLYLGDQLGIPGILSQYRIEGAGFSDGMTSPVGFPIKLKVHQDHLLVAHRAGLTIIELLDQSAFGTATTYDFGIEATDITSLNDTAYLIGETDTGMALMEIGLTDLNSPMVTTTQLLDIGSNIPTSIAVDNQHIYIAAGAAGLIKLNN